MTLAPANDASVAALQAAAATGAAHVAAATHACSANKATKSTKGATGKKKSWATAQIEDKENGVDPIEPTVDLRVSSEDDECV